jgi:hypothetical protein
MCIIINTSAILYFLKMSRMVAALAQGSVPAGLRSSSLAGAVGHRGISMIVGHRDTYKVSEEYLC